MEQVLNELEVHIEKHLEDQAIVDGYENPAADLLTKVHAAISHDFAEKQRMEKIDKALGSLRDIMLTHPQIKFTDYFMGHLVGMKENPERYHGHAWEPRHVVEGGIDALLQRGDARQNRAGGIRFEADAMVDIPEVVPEVVPDDNFIRDRDGVVFNKRRVRSIVGQIPIPAAQVQYAVRDRNMSLRAMGWEVY